MTPLESLGHCSRAIQRGALAIVLAGISRLASAVTWVARAFWRWS